ncbi:MAG: outer membrane lipoprotein carrier protein LolA [Thermoanaerobaculia bacterium]
MHRSVPILGLLMLAAGAIGSAQLPEERDVPSPLDRSLPPSARLEAVAERVRRAHDSLETLEAEFSQRKQSALLLEPDVATGRFSYTAPDKVRWEYLSPDPISLVIADRTMTTWYRDIGQVERAAVGAQADRVLRYLGAGTSLDRLLEYFTVSLSVSAKEGEPLKLKLSPRFERVARRIQEMELWLDPGLYLPVRLRYVEGDGDVTEYNFANFRKNEGIPSDRFELEWPEEVEVREVQLDSRAGAR